MNTQTTNVGADALLELLKSRREAAMEVLKSRREAAMEVLIDLEHLIADIVYKDYYTGHICSRMGSLPEGFFRKTAEVSFRLDDESFLFILPESRVCSYMKSDGCLAVYSTEANPYIADLVAKYKALAAEIAKSIALRDED